VPGVRQAGDVQTPAEVPNDGALAVLVMRHLFLAPRPERVRFASVRLIGVRSNTSRTLSRWAGTTASAASAGGRVSVDLVVAGAERSVPERVVAWPSAQACWPLLLAEAKRAGRLPVSAATARRGGLRLGGCVAAHRLRAGGETPREARGGRTAP
jgi:hypothetical protein